MTPPSHVGRGRNPNTMKTILALSLIAASFAMIPTVDASCDPTFTVCSSTYGTCDNGSTYNSASVYNYDANGYTSVGAYTQCYGYPGYYSGDSIGAGATSCDASWNCNYVGAYWQSFEFFGSGYCDTAAYAYAGGQYNYQSLGCPAGGPPEVPALLP